MATTNSGQSLECESAPFVFFSFEIFLVVMFSPDQYELIDFGNIGGEGFKLERFNGQTVSRPCPAAENHRIKHGHQWELCDGAFTCKAGDRGPMATDETVRGSWSFRRKLPEQWTVQHDSVIFRLKATPFGHLGVFVEQQENWDWIARQVHSANKPVKVLNLFAYTGGSTLAAAAAGADVVHIDSAKNVVQWARENAGLSGLEENPIRWIVEDSSLFVEREIKRKNKYDAIILDPPSFGRGPKGEVWKIDRDLIRLLRQCRKLLSDSPAFLLLTCHSPGIGPAELQAFLCDSIFGTCSTQVAASPLSIQTADGRRLNAGNAVHWPR